MIRSAAITILISLSISLITAVVILKSFRYTHLISIDMIIIMFAVSAIACTLAVARTFFSKLSWAGSNCMTAVIASLVAAFSYPNTNNAPAPQHLPAANSIASTGSNMYDQTRCFRTFKLYTSCRSAASNFLQFLNSLPLLKTMRKFLESLAFRLSKYRPRQTKRGVHLCGSVGHIASLADEHGIDIAFDWSSPLVLAPLVEWTRPSIDKTLNSVMRLLTLPSVTNDQTARCELVEMQRYLHAARSALEISDRLTLEEKSLLEELLRERVSKLNSMLRG